MMQMHAEGEGGDERTCLVYQNGERYIERYRTERRERKALGVWVLEPQQKELLCV